MTHTVRQRRYVEAKSILLVEDNLDDVLLTLRALRKNGVKNEVVVACDGAEALDYLFAGEGNAGRNTSLMPQLVLLDLRLPKVDGLEVLRRLRTEQQTKSLPVVILISGEGERGMVAGCGLRADLYIQKTVDFVGFSREVRRLKPLLSSNERTTAGGQEHDA